MQSSNTIALLGAGPVGSVLAIILAKKGYNVEIFERSKNISQGIDHSKRQINFGISLRGVQAFKIIEVWDKIEKHSIPMYARTYHNRDGTVRNHQYGKRHEAIYSIRSEVLTNLLLKQVATYENIKIHYDTSLNDVNIENFGYIETLIPANNQNEFAFNPNSFHMWTNDDFHIIAMPNKNKTFTCNLFLPMEGDISFATVKSNEDFKKFMKMYFPELAEQMVYHEQTLTPDKVGRLYDYKCYPWAFNNFCLFGNTAHQIFPYFGQGLNAGLEDCTIMCDLIEKYKDDWKVITQNFQTSRKPNTDAITDLAKQNFETLKTQMFDDEFQEKKLIINYLSDNYEDLFMSQYQLIEFSNIDFYKAKSFEKVEEEIVRQIRMIPNFDKIIENNKRDSIIRQILRSFVGKYQVETTAVEIINQLGVLSKNQEVILLPNIGQFEISEVQNCSRIAPISLIEQIHELKQFKGDFSRARLKHDSSIRGSKNFDQTLIGLCLEIELNKDQTIDSKIINEAYEKSILKSIQQSMKNINNIYKVVILKVQNHNGAHIGFSPDAILTLIEKEFQIISTNGFLMTGGDDDYYIQDFIGKEEHMIVEMLNLEQIEYGAYTINIESQESQTNAAPISFKARKILNAELLDIYAHKKREVYYSEYLAVEELISLMRNRTDYLEEKLFIRVHQINELAMQQSIITLEALVKVFKSKKVIENLETIEEYIHQVLRFFIVQKETNFVLCNMSTKNFVHGFRSALGTASGVQSCQFYIMQILLGLSMDRHILNDPEKLLQLKEYDIQKIKTYKNHDSMFKVIQEWLLDFYNETEDVRKIGELPHIEQILKDCKDFSREVAITVLYLLNNTHLLQYKIVEYLLKFESSFLTFLDSHIVLVDHHLGNKRGTGRSSGGNYLRQSKMSQIIWRDLYYLQNHASSIYDWAKIKQLPATLDNDLHSAQSILEDLNDQGYKEEIIDFTSKILSYKNNVSIESESLTRAQMLIKDKLKHQFITNFHSDVNVKEAVDLARRDIAARYERNGITINHEHIILNNNQTSSLETIFKHFLRKEDNILVFTPFASSIQKISQQQGVEIKYLNVLNQSKIEVSSESLLTLIDMHTKAIMIPNFSELIGQDFSQEELQVIISVCNYHKLFIIYDESSYLSSQHTTLHILHMASQVPTLIVSNIPEVNGMKEFGISWVVPVNHHNYFGQVHDQIISKKQDQTVSLATLTCIRFILEELGEMRKERFNEGQIQLSSKIATKINKIPGLSTLVPIQPQNFIVHLELEKFKDIPNDIQFAKALLNQKGVKVLPSQVMHQPSQILLIIDQDESIVMKGLEDLEQFCLDNLKVES
eukprot:403370753